MPTITIVVPTHNQSRRLSAILEMLTTSAIECPIVVVDSSEELQSNFGSAQTGLFSYFHMPKLGLVEKIAHALSLVKTDYVLLHPDGELLNPDVFRLMQRALEPQHVSTVALNLTVISTDLQTEIAFRNFHRFPFWRTKRMPRLENCLAPYYQMVWGIHKTNLAQEFFLAMSRLEWTRDKGNHAMLFERACNFYMCSQGEILVCEKPLYLRMPKTKNADFEILSLSQWMDAFFSGCVSKARFINDLSEAIAPFIQSSHEVVHGKLIEALKNEWLYLRRNQTVWARLKRRIFRVWRDRRFIMPGPEMIFITAKRDEVPRAYFKFVVGGEIARWVMSAKKWFPAYRS